LLFIYPVVFFTTDTLTAMHALDGEWTPHSMEDVSEFVAKQIEAEMDYMWQMRSEAQEFCASEARLLRAYAGSITGGHHGTLDGSM
jgi:hypothetical protein